MGVLFSVSKTLQSATVQKAYENLLLSRGDGPGWLGCYRRPALRPDRQQRKLAFPSKEKVLLGALARFSEQCGAEFLLFFLFALIPPRNYIPGIPGGPSLGLE